MYLTSLCSLPLCSLLKPRVKSRMKMWVLLQQHLSDQWFYYTWSCYYIWSCWGYTGFTPSIHPSRIPCPLCSTYSFGWIHFIFIHLIKQLQKMCRMWFVLQNYKICSFGNFLKFVTLTLSCFRLGSDVNHKYGWSWGSRDISERRRSSCSSCLLRCDLC